MSAGTGISHSEFNNEDEETNIFQIWIMPKSHGIEPSWDAAEFPKTPSGDTLPLLVSGDGSAPLCVRFSANGSEHESCELRQLVPRPCRLVSS